MCVCVCLCVCCVRACSCQSEPLNDMESTKSGNRCQVDAEATQSAVLWFCCFSNCCCCCCRWWCVCVCALICKCVLLYLCVVQSNQKCIIRCHFTTTVAFVLCVLLIIGCFSRCSLVGFPIVFRHGTCACLYLIGWQFCYNCRCKRCNTSTQ